MTARSDQRQPAQLGATFYPGGNDDFYMPEVVSPAPQRIMPEVPEQIQDKLAHLELDADPSGRLSGLQTPLPNAGSTAPHLSSRDSAVSVLTTSSEEARGHGHSRLEPNVLDQPTFSPFPRLPNRPTNVPPSDAEREMILENARLPVLNSNDPEMQLTWAQDTLAYVEIASHNALRDAANQLSRPQTPRVEHQLRQDAVNIVSFLAEQHHPKADFIQGMWLEFGKFNFRMDKKEAYRCYARAAQKKYARAEYRIGMQFESSNDMTKAIKHYTQGVEAGDSASHYRLGMMALLGQHGQSLDYERGIRLISFAAETADENAPQGAYVFGMLQAREIPQVNVPEHFLPLNMIAARFNIEKAAYLGFAKAQTKMGAAYELCQLGCDFDPALSLHYNALAARQGDPDAEMSISKWFLCGYDGVFDKSDELAFAYARRATQSGLATAEFAMGYFFEIGMYVPVDLKEARQWYTKASEHGNKDASARIDGISRSHTLSRKDHENVAIARIKSQHGSQRGKRPERFKQTTTPMPTISDSPVPMPDPYQSGASGVTQHQRHPSMEGPPLRPVSTAPYPTDNGPEPRLKPRPVHSSTSSFPHPSPRPQPDFRPNSAASMSTVPPDGYYRRGTPASVRPPVLLSDTGSGRGRATPGLVVGPGPGLQGQRHTSGGVASPSTVSPQVSNLSRPQSVPSPAIDIGFSAPLDPSGADRRRRLQKGDPSSAGTPRPLPTPSNYNAGPNSDSPKLSRPPHVSAQSLSGQSHPSGPARRSGLSDVHHEPKPSHSRLGSPVTAPTSFPPSTPEASTPATAQPPPSTAPTRPPGKGPQTFEEMGVPQVKKDSECVLM